MVVSNLESFVLRWLLAAVVEAASRRALTDEDMRQAHELGDWMSSPGISRRAQVERDHGDYSEDGYWWMWSNATPYDEIDDN